MRLIPQSILTICGIVTFMVGSCHSARSVDSSALGINSESKLIAVLAPMLKKRKMGARINFKAICERSNNRTVNLSPSSQIIFPYIRINSASANTGTFTVRNVFLDDKTVTVHKGMSGTIIINIGNVDKGILATEISVVRLQPIARYTPEAAIEAILNNRNVKLAERRLGVTSPSTFSEFMIEMPAKGLRHLPKTIENVTLDEALDMVANTFDGIVLYGYCQDMHQYEIRFAGGTYFDGADGASGRGSR